MKNRLTIIALTLTVIIGGVVWYVQSTPKNHQNAVIARGAATQSQNNNVVIARSETTKQSPPKNPATTTPSTTNTAANTQNHNTTTDTAIRYNADGSIDTSNWQEYCNQEYGFCVKYPDGFIVPDAGDSQIKPVIVVFRDKDVSPEKNGSFFDYAMTGEDRNTIERTREYYTEEYRRPDYIGEEIGVNSHGIEFVRFDYFANSLGNRSEYPASIYYFKLHEGEYIGLRLVGFSLPRKITTLQMRGIAESFKVKD